MGLIDVKGKQALLLTESLLNPDIPMICYKCRIHFLYDHNDNIRVDAHIIHTKLDLGKCESRLHYLLKMIMPIIN